MFLMVATVCKDKDMRPPTSDPCPTHRTTTAAAVAAAAPTTTVHRNDPGSPNSNSNSNSIPTYLNPIAIQPVNPILNLNFDPNSLICYMVQVAGIGPIGRWGWIPGLVSLHGILFVIIIIVVVVQVSWTFQPSPTTILFTPP